ncbi:hypothetical protein JCM19233_7504 [Vibrio astriarenae]|nr:hypothetical protein JCM19233_7504 [Vibrio sp. C7]
MKKIILATLIASASSSVFAVGIGIPADSATVKSDVPAVCAISTEGVDTQLDLGRGKAEVTFAAINNVSPLATINIQGYTQLELMAHLDAHTTNQAVRNTK